VTSTRPTHAVVLGGSWAGLWAAHALARHVETVTVVERDILPDGPEHRKGLPQGHHTHLLWSGGARILDTLLPGITDRLYAAGARRIGVHKDLVTLTSHGWQHRFPTEQYAIMCSRPLLDSVVRRQILGTGRITLRHGTEVVNLTGGSDRVTGVRIRDVDSGAESALEADLVVDATGRGSRLKHWLVMLGVPAVEEDIVDVGIRYATRIFQAPDGATTGFPAVNVLADYRDREPGCNGAVYPIEDGRWIVTLSGTRGAQLPTQEDDFLAFAERLRHPIVADLIRHAPPLTPIFTTHTGIDRRLYPERQPGWPDGQLIFGDSLAAFNPIYGHGLSTAARAAAVLDEQLRLAEHGGWRSQQVQQAICAAVDDPWIMATSRDISFVECRNYAKDPRLTTGAAALLSFAEVVASKTIRAPKVAEMVTNVTSLAASQSELGTSRFLFTMQQDALRPELTGPPLDPDELSIVNLKVRGTVGAHGIPG
jgi:2-polyprenyl-6-methoxyphenol hydroxylase-like FAD-dependent oxidoreductase